MSHLPWHETQWRALVRRQTEGRLPHALLLHGSAGGGKAQFATAFAEYLLCESPTADAQPCGGCRSCRLLAAGSHPDLLTVNPAEESKSRRIGVSQIRDAAAFQALKSQYGRHKLIVIEPADAMNANAANALLKTLEEPTEGTVLLLSSSRPSSLPATIRSRCQGVGMPLPQREIALAWLANRGGIEEKEAAALLAAAGGAPVAALELARTGGSGQRAEVFTEFEAVAAGRADPVRCAEKWQPLELQELLLWLHGWIADMIRMKCDTGHAALADADLTARLQAFAQGLDLSTLYQRLDQLMEAQRDARRQINAQLLLEDILIAWAAVPGIQQRARTNRGQ